ncbi:uncharacterized protein LOC133907375 isoform X2 [Phragmites australis]|uniref:uncharacterized protein LOC133907375 isoform X2 n=1 Tax=Phragmites australis TaxID=29695 RepID=UPI002D770B18|nr:uncharacterized protein LOC133907375 isoform X2 [Phragmites australis]XP_062205391.1 uncharacterized protein LOC133907375 isoform X2 [Phragmites australis]XP_062205392.1 uncharacterized protein LOC133907375 isoform X2 [Phragmites australis]XP_062205393.1 uncharacterized protein LOC133907375 isoform X2 [Phragmites australis]
MAGSRPGESNGGATSSILPVAGQLKPLPDYAISLVRDYDIQGVTAMLSSLAHCSFEVQMEAFSKNLELFKKPNAIGAFPDEGKAKDEEEDVEDEEDDEVDEDEDDDVDEDGEDGEDEEGEKGEDEEILKLQVRNEGERECKKPRLAKGFGCQAEAAV